MVNSGWLLLLLDGLWMDACISWWTNLQNELAAKDLNINTRTCSLYRSTASSEGRVGKKDCGVNNTTMNSVDEKTTKVLHCARTSQDVQLYNCTRHKMLLPGANKHHWEGPNWCYTARYGDHLTTAQGSQGGVGGHPPKSRVFSQPMPA